jgi:hypothetical protein
MVLSDKDIIKFQELYKKHFGINISREEALDQGGKLLRLVSIVYKPFVEKESNSIPNPPRQ